MSSEKERDIYPIIFTDLDGTLLDHETYDFSPAQEALGWIAEHKIPLILASSKTAAEIADLQRQLDLNYPAIIENGGGVWLPEDFFSNSRLIPPPGITYDGILAVLSELPEKQRAGFTGFCDWSIAEIAEQTGLTLEAAAMAADRKWSVPGLWHGTDSEYREFSEYLNKSGIKITQGGRFIHLMGDTSKGIMLRWLRDRFRAEFPKKTIVTVALGDAPNDRAMLEAADHAIVIPNLSGRILELNPEKMKGVVHYADLPGPCGWNNTILPLIKSFNLSV